MTHEPLEEAALEWLRYERGCYVLALERGLDHCYRPDVLGVNRKLFLLEIEVKRTLSDFKANGSKRDFHVVEPRQRWFMVPQSLVALVQPILPTGWGLMTLRPGGIPTPSGLPGVDVVFPAPTRDTRPLKAFELAKMVRHQSGTLVSVAVSRHRFRQLLQSPPGPPEPRWI